MIQARITGSLNDGTIVWDRNKDLYNEEGTVLRVDKTGSFSQSLLNWLGKDVANEFLNAKGIDTSDFTDSQIAEKLFTESGATWDNTGVNPNTQIPTGAWVDSNGNSSLENLFSFQLTEEYAFNLGKISQESPDIAYFVGKNNNVNAMAQTGCYYMSTLGAVQTQTNRLLTADNINYITLTSINNDWLKTDDVSIWPAGDVAREAISSLAYTVLGYSGYSLNFTNPTNPVGQINVGYTINNHNHASEWNMTNLLYDPYQGINYSIPTIQTLPYTVTKPIYDFKNLWKSRISGVNK